MESSSTVRCTPTDLLSTYCSVSTELRAGQILVIFGQCVVVLLSKNIKCLSPPNYACSNDCFFACTIKKSHILESIGSIFFSFFLRTIPRCDFFEKIPRCNFFMVCGLVMAKNTHSNRHGFEDMNILYFWTWELPQTDQKLFVCTTLWMTIPYSFMSKILNYFFKHLP